MSEIVTDSAGAPMDWPLEFGVFMPPINLPVGGNAHLMLHENVRLIQHAEQLGFSEAWFGEHHSGGTELIGSPELFIAHVAAHTERIRLGTGVISLPYHHPFHVAQRIVLLDHLTRGRLSVGVGPGLLATDAYMLGIESTRQREMMLESLEVIFDLLDGKRVSRSTDWFTVNEAALHLAPFQFPRPEFALAATFTPNGPQTAGRLGTGLLSLAAASEAGFEVLNEHWKLVEEGCAANGHVADRRQWRHVVAVHIAETEEQAIEDVRFGLPGLIEYLSGVLPGFESDPSWSHEELVTRAQAGGFCIGTPETAIKQIQDLWDQSGGFGKFLIMGFDMAGREARYRSYELFAREVIPRFNGQGLRSRESYDWTRAGADKWLGRTVDAIKAAGGMQDKGLLST